MQLGIEVNLDLELEKLLGKLLEAMQDLATVIAPLTGYRVLPDSDDEHSDHDRR